MTSGEGVGAADPPPPVEPDPSLVLVPLGPPQFYASYFCPGCQRVRRFKSRAPRLGDVGPHVCDCGRLLGVVVVDHLGMTLLRLTCGA